MFCFIKSQNNAEKVYINNGTCLVCLLTNRYRPGKSCIIKMLMKSLSQKSSIMNKSHELHISVISKSSKKYRISENRRIFRHVKKNRRNPLEMCANQNEKVGVKIVCLLCFLFINCKMRCKTTE